MDSFDAMMFGVCLVIFALVSIGDYISDGKRRRRRRLRQQQPRQTEPLDFELPTLRREEPIDPTPGYDTPSEIYQREKAHQQQAQERYRRFVLAERAEHDDPERAPRASECDGLEPMAMPLPPRFPSPKPAFTLPPLTPSALVNGLVYAEILGKPKALRRRR